VVSLVEGLHAMFHRVEEWADEAADQGADEKEVKRHGLH
jgi:hypothetical protein